MAKTFNVEKAKDRLLQARKIAETKPYGYVGRAEGGDPFAAQTDTGLNNVIYGRIGEEVDTVLLYYKPSVNAGILKNGMSVEIEWRDRKPWIVDVYPEVAVDQLGGSFVPTDMTSMQHGHTSSSDGGTLGTDSVSTSAITDSAVTTAKIADNAVTTVKVTDANITTAKIADANVTTAKIADDAITPAKIDSLGSAEDGHVLKSGSSFVTKKVTTTTTDPTTTDDSSAGYAVLSFWLNTVSGEIFMCVDNTASAAVWTSITSSGGGGAPTTSTYVTINDETGTLTNSQWEPNFLGSVYINTGNSLNKHLRVESNTGGIAFDVLSQGGIGIGLSGLNGTRVNIGSNGLTNSALRFAGGVDKTTGLTDGDFWYNNTSKTFKYYDGTTTQELSTGSGVSAIPVPLDEGGSNADLSAASDGPVYKSGSAMATESALSANRGGTGNTTLTSGGIVIGAGTSPVSTLTGTQRTVVYHNGTNWSANSNPELNSLSFSNSPAANGYMGRDSSNRYFQIQELSNDFDIPLTMFRLSSNSTVASTASETSFTLSGRGTATIPAGFLTVGKTFEIEAWGRVSTTGTPTLRTRLYLGSTVVINTGTFTFGTVTNDIYHWRGIFTCQSTGASGTVEGQAIARLSNAVSSNGVNGSSTINTTTSQAITLRVTWSAASASNTVTLTNLTIKVI